MRAAREKHGTVERVAYLALRTTDQPWPFAEANAEAIARNWEKRQAANPAFYNGRVFVLRSLARTAGGYEGVFSLEAFAAMLYWHDHGAGDPGTLDGFGSALVRSVEGHIMLSVQAPGMLNAGKAFLPGGFLDERDAGNGLIDLDEAVARELVEETGLEAGALAREPGYLVTRIGRYCAFAVAYRSPLPARDLRAAMRAGLEQDAARELADITIVASPSDMDGLDVLPHARLLVTAVLGGRV